MTIEIEIPIKIRVEGIIDPITGKRRGGILTGGRFNFHGRMISADTDIFLDEGKMVEIFGDNNYAKG